MQKTNVRLFITVFFFVLNINAQHQDLNGQLIANSDIEGIHILNKTSSKYTISNENGGFVITAKVSDTIFISGVKYEPKQVIVTSQIINSKLFSVQLVEKVNELNEVVVGETLTGSLKSDMKNLNVKPEINFYDLGIPGNTDLPLTQSEQRLYDADHGQFIYYYGIGLSINVHKILNRINGDTNKYKRRVEIEFKEKCLNQLQSEYSQAIFDVISIPKDYEEEFFQFCIEDKQFKSLCEEKNKFNTVDFFLDKLEIFKNNLNGDD